MGEQATSHTQLPIATGYEVGAELARYTRGHRITAALAVAAGLAGAALGLLVPFAIESLVDRVAAGSAQNEDLVRAAVIMCVGTLSGAVCTAASVRWAANLYHTMLATLRERLVERSMTLPQHTVERAGSGDLISRSSDDVSVIGDSAAQLIPALSSSVFAVIVAAVGLFGVDWQYGLALLTMIPVYIIAVRWYLRIAPAVYRAERSAMSGRAQYMLESQRGYSTIVGFGLSERRHHHVLDASWSVVGHTLRARTVQNMFLGRIFLAQYLGLGVILVVGFVLIAAGHSSVGAATAATLILMRLFGPITQLFMVFDIVQSVAASLGRIVGVIRVEDDRRTDVVQFDEAGAVRAENIVFAYPDGRTAVSDVTVEIAAGQHVAVVGASGAGKTTLAGIIAGVHEPQAGVVQRPRRTAVVTQETHVFGGTVRDNLTLAAPEADDEGVLEALRVIGADKVLDDLPNGLDTEVGPRGHVLTPAQIQQIALARVVLADPTFAIFDEATAEAGSAQAGELDRATTAALEGRTGMLIAHRLSQAAACDRIIVLDEGVLVEDGDHDCLRCSDGIYAQLWAAWSRGYEVSHDDNRG